MVQLEWPWMLLALPLPFLIRFLVPPLRAERATNLLVPFADDFAGADISGKPATSNRPLLWLASIGWILLVGAAARPVIVGEPVELQVSGRNLLLAIDLSGSMQTEDFLVNNRHITRLAATKEVAGAFIKRRVGDRIGLLLFGTRPYLQAPLTFDRQTVQTLLQEAVIGLAGEQTAIGDAIGLGVKRLTVLPAQNRVLLLLTDGANTAGSIDPEKAAEFAHQAGITIYTIGVGAEEMIVSSLFGRRRVNPSRDLDETTLTRVAEITGGRYFRARNTGELEEIYEVIDQIEPVNSGNQFFRETTEVFWWPLLAALLLMPAVVAKGGRDR